MSTFEKIWEFVWLVEVEGGLLLVLHLLRWRGSSLYAGIIRILRERAKLEPRKSIIRIPAA